MIRDKLTERWQDLYDGLRFEWAATWGRMRQSRRIAPGTDRLHLGCGDNLIPGFLNTDVFANRKADLGVDLRFPLPFADDTFSCIYSHHVVEHLSYPHSRALFAEARRVLGKGGVLRIGVPDLGKFALRYANDTSAEYVAGLLPPHHRQGGWRTGMEVLDHLFRDTKWNRHLSAWDARTLRLELEEAGFSGVRSMACGESASPHMAGLDYSDWAAQSLYMEAVA